MCIGKPIVGSKEKFTYVMLRGREIAAEQRIPLFDGMDKAAEEWESARR